LVSPFVGLSSSLISSVVLSFREELLACVSLQALRIG